MRRPFRAPHCALLMLAVLGALVSLVAPRTAWCWGGATHRWIAAHYSQDLPGTIDGLRVWDSVVVAHVTDPDTRKGTTPGESYLHYIDVDSYPEFLAGTLTHSRSVLESEYGASVVLNNGVVPWAVADTRTKLVQQMRAAQWSNVALTIADLCHYVGDAHQPLHCTRNYDGQLTGNSGIHSRYETDMMAGVLGVLTEPVRPARYWPSVVDTMFRAIGESWSAVAPILAGDDDAKSRTGGQYNADYYTTLWYDVGPLTQARLDSACVATASIVYSAWLDAGQPVVPGSSLSVAPQPHATQLALHAWPTPFRDQLVLSYDGPGPLSVDVYDVRGAHVAQLVSGAGSAGSVTWRPRANGARLDAGLYFVRIRSAAGSRVLRVSYLQ